MTYIELYEQAEYDLKHNLITLGEYEERIKPLEQEVRQTGKYIDGDLLFSKIAGHSDYHGDSILSAISCLQEGKEIKQVPAIGDNE